MSVPRRPRKRFGQHFLKDPGAIQQTLGAIAPRSEDTIVEIGPGRGALTGSLARTGAELHLVEIDRDLAAELAERYENTPNVQVHQADALRFNFATLGNGLRVVGNLPYNISTPLLFHLLDQIEAIRDMYFMLQKEVVDRIAASPGNKQYGRLTVMLGCHLDAQHLFDVAPDAFDPPPKVMSSVVCLLPKVAAPNVDSIAMRKIVTQAFSQRRKTLHNALKGHVSDEMLRSVGLKPGMRAEQVAVDQWIDLVSALSRP